MDISVIVPIYRVEDYIERCLRSLFTQTKTDGVEFILVNDATPDRSMEIARKIVAEYPDLNIQIIEHSENRHVAATRQTGLNAATGEYTIQIDSDDWCEPTMLEDMYAKAIKPGVDIVISDYYTWSGDTAYIYKHEDVYDRFTLIHHLLQGKVQGILWNKFVKRSLYINNNIVFEAGVNYCEDLLSVAKLVYFSKSISYLPKIYLHYTYREGSITNTPYIDRSLDVELFYFYIDKFLREEGVYKEFHKELLKKKLKYKLYRLRRSDDKKSFKHASNLFPETTKDIFKVDYLLITTKIPFYLASIGFLTMANLIFNLSNWYHSKKHKL